MVLFNDLFLQIGIYFFAEKVYTISDSEGGDTMDKRDKFLIVKVSDAEREAIRKAARARGLTMSALTRYVLIAGLSRVKEGEEEK